MSSALFKVSIIMIKHHHQINLEEESVYFTFHLINPSLMEPRTETQSRTLDTATEAKSMEENCIVALLPWLTQFLFLDNSVLAT